MSPQSVPFDPPFGAITHEYRVTVADAGVMFQTQWYIEGYAMAVLASLRRAYPSSRITLQRRAVTGNIETVA